MSPNGRVLVLTNRYPKSPQDYAGWYVERHVELHRQSGWDVEVLAPSAIGGRRLLEYGVMALKLAPRIVKRDFDVIHAHWILPSGLLGLGLSRLTGKPLVVTSHGAFTRDFATASPLQKRAVQMVLTGADWLIGVGIEHVDRMNQIADGNLKAVSLIHMGIDLASPLESRRAARKALGIDQTAFLIVFVGNMYHRKGAHVLLDACALLQSNGVAFQLRMAGWGPKLTALRLKCARLGMDPNQVFVGAVSHPSVPRFYRAADVVVVPSLDEPSGLVAMEAMAAGSAVIASDVGGLTEHIRNGETGLLVPAGDPEVLAGAVRRLRESPELLLSLRRGAEQAGVDFDIRRQAQAVGQVYQQAMGVGDEDA